MSHLDMSRINEAVSLMLWKPCREAEFTPAACLGPNRVTRREAGIKPLRVSRPKQDSHTHLGGGVDCCLRGQAFVP